MNNRSILMLVLLLALLLAVGCQNFADIDGYTFGPVDSSSEVNNQTDMIVAHDTASETGSLMDTTSAVTGGIDTADVSTESTTDTNADTASTMDTLSSTESSTENSTENSTESVTDMATDTDTDTDSGADTGIVADSDRDTETHSSPAPDTDTATNSDSESETVTNVDTNTGSDSSPCTPLEPQAIQQCGLDGHVHWFDSYGEEGELITTCNQCQLCENINADSAHCVVAPDFTDCDVITSPDRAYDICVDGTCVSPGCGTADCNVPRPYFPLADTGQRSCFNNSSNLVSCPSPEDEFYGQDAQYGWDISHTPDDRFSRILDIAEEPVVRDNITGLFWQGCSGGLRGEDCTFDDNTMEQGGSKYTWEEALAYCNSLEWGGHTDWRLPDEFALQSIVDYGESSPSIDESVFPQTIDDVYWSSSTTSEDAPWYIQFRFGYKNFKDKDSYNYTRCMRSEASPVSHIEVSTDTGDRTVTDYVNSLIWQGCAAGKSGTNCTGTALSMDWGDALKYCDDLYWDNSDDWRLPNIVELSSIVDNREHEPAIDPALFPQTDIDSSHLTSSSHDPHDGWCVLFASGKFGITDKNSHVNYVRCVRDMP